MEEHLAESMVDPTVAHLVGKLVLQSVDKKAAQRVASLVLQ